MSKLKLGLAAVCILSLGADILLHRHSHFGEHGIDGLFGFYAVMAFAGCAIIALITVGVGKLLRVEDNFYERF